MTLRRRRRRCPRPSLRPAMERGTSRRERRCQIGADLIHPGAGAFRIMAGYECVGDRNRRLDAAAIEAQIKEAGKNTTRVNTARAGALQKLKDAQARHIDLRDVTLWHLMELVKEASPAIARKKLEQCGVESDDAAKVVALLAGRAKAARESGLDRVRALLENGQLLVRPSPSRARWLLRRPGDGRAGGAGGQRQGTGTGGPDDPGGRGQAAAGRGARRDAAERGDADQPGGRGTRAAHPAARAARPAARHR